MSLERPNKLGEKLEAQKPQVDVKKLRENRDQRNRAIRISKNKQEAQKNGEEILLVHDALGLGKYESKLRAPPMEKEYTYRAIGGVDATSFEEKKINTADLVKMSALARKFADLYLGEGRIVSNFSTLKGEDSEAEVLAIIEDIGNVDAQVKKGTFDLEKFKNSLKDRSYDLVYGPQGVFNILLAIHRADEAVKDKNSTNVVYDLRIGNKKLSQSLRYTELRRKTIKVKGVQSPEEVMADAEKGLDRKAAVKEKVQAVFDRNIFDKNVAEFFSGKYLKEVCPGCDVAKDKIKGKYEGGVEVNDAKYLIMTKHGKYFVYPSGGKMGTVELKVIKEVSNNKFELVVVDEILTGNLDGEDAKKALAVAINKTIEKQEGRGPKKEGAGLVD